MTRDQRIIRAKVGLLELARQLGKSHGKPMVDDRRLLSGIIFINRDGLRWCDAPWEYGPHKTLCNRWKRQPAKSGGKISALHAW